MTALARRCAELMDENDRLREQVYGLQAALEMRVALKAYTGSTHHLVVGDTLKLQCDCGGCYQLKPHSSVTLEIL